MDLNNEAIFGANWQSWLDMKVHGPASRWLRSLIRAHIRRISKPENIDSVLDVGCGEGTITFHLAKWFPNAQIVGIDFSESGIQCARSRYQLANLQFIHDISSHELARKYDLVTLFEVLEHVENWRALLERVTQSATQFVMLSFPTGRMRPFEKNVGHYRNFRHGEVERFLSDRRFEPVAVSYAGFPFFSPLYREFCNVTQASSNSLVTGTYGWPQKILSSAIYCLFRFFSSQRRFGDQFCGLFKCKAV
jgi:SAM-dependent methyltransferase